jgi:hypothetical protein
MVFGCRGTAPTNTQLGFFWGVTGSYGDALLNPEKRRIRLMAGVWASAISIKGLSKLLP